jgi:hypothetical protein
MGRAMIGRRIERCHRQGQAMNSLMLGFVLLLLLIAAVSLLAFHARPRTLIEKLANGEVDHQTLQVLALSGAAGAGGDGGAAGN